MRLRPPNDAAEMPRVILAVISEISSLTNTKINALTNAMIKAMSQAKIKAKIKALTTHDVGNFTHAELILTLVDATLQLKANIT